MHVDRFSAVHHDALSCAESIYHGKEISPLRHFLRGGPFFQRCLLHDFLPELRIVHHHFVQRSNDASGIETVADGAIFSHAHRHIFGVRHHTALAGTIFRKFRTRMSTGRTDIQYCLDIFLDAIFFGKMNQSFQIDIDNVLILRAGIVDKHFYSIDMGQMLVISDITLKMLIRICRNARLLTIDADDLMSL